MMDKGNSERDLDLEYAGSIGTDPSKGSYTILFPPIFQSQATSSETLDSEEPPLCKRIVHVHRRASEKQQRLDAAWLRTEDAEQTDQPPVHFTSQRCSRFANNLVERADENSHKSATVMKVPYIVEGWHFLRQNLSVFAHQWRDGARLRSKWTIVEACARVTCFNWAWSLVMGAWLEQKTSKRWGPVETLLSTAICGSLFDLLGGQAILVVGPSSPSVIFIIAITTTAKHLGLDAVPWMGWIGMWASLILLLLAMSNACRMMARITTFSWRVVCTFIRFTFLWEAFDQIIHMFKHFAPDSALLSLWFATTAFFVLLLLENTRRWHLFECRVHHAFADYGMILVMLFFTAIQYLPKLNQTHVPQVSLPQIGHHTDQLSRLGYITLMKPLPIWAILLAVIPGIMLAGLIFIYHSATSSLLQDATSSVPQYKNSIKWDLCIITLLVFLCGIFGLPFACGTLYQSQLHVRALTMKSNDHLDIEERRGLAEICIQRMSGLAASIFSAAFILPPARWIISKVPLAVLTGLLSLQAVHFDGNWDITIVITDIFQKKQLRSHPQCVSYSAVCVYTVSQLSCVLIILAVSKTPAAVLFPLFIFMTFWVRHSAMHRLFKREEFMELDMTLIKECSDMSSSGPISTASRDTHARGHQQAWPKISITHTLQSVITVPRADVHESRQHESINVESTHADFIAESGESPLPLPISPSLLHASTRRLKERSRRRGKKKRQTCTDNMQEVSSEQQAEEHPDYIPPLVKAMMEGHNCPSAYEEDDDIYLNKRVSPGLSPQFFRKSKQRTEQDSPLEVHSNLLYEPKKQGTKQKPAQSEEPSPTVANVSTQEENDTEIQDPNQRLEFGRFHGSPGIGRCIRSPPVLKVQSPTRRRQLRFSIAIPRRRAFPKEEIYPNNVGAQPDAPRKSYPRLRRSSTSRWPTTRQAPAHMNHQQQLQRHSTSTTNDQIGCVI